MKDVVSQKLPMTSRTGTGKKSIEERAIKLAQYIIDTKDTVRGAAKKFGVSKSTVHMDVTQKNGKENVGVDAHIDLFQRRDRKSVV